MGRRASADESDRYLVERAGHWQYKRKVPANVADLDERAPLVRISLKTADLAEARQKRDQLEHADNEFWASLLVGGQPDAARRRYRSMVLRAEALGFSYRPVEQQAESDTAEAIVSRFKAIGQGQQLVTEHAVLGLATAPAVTVRQAFKIYTDEIMRDELKGKSQLQLDEWKKVKSRAVENFVRLVDDRPIGDITRDDALKLYQHWMDRIAPKNRKADPTATASSGNRDVGNMRELFRAYHVYIGDRDRKNPFEGLSFTENKVRKRPPFSEGFIKRRFLQGRALSRLNNEARGILLMVIAIGGRPSEIANLDPATDIFLTAPVPYIEIQPHEEGENRREIKTRSSRRQVPLVGLGLAVMKKNPNGFPRYRNRERSLSGTLNEFMRDNHLLETPKHSTYGFRHSFEDRMKVGGIDVELRKILMGHSIDRPDYGVGGTLEWRARELNKVSLPFDAAIV